MTDIPAERREPTPQAEVDDAIREARRGLNALRLEVVPEIADDVSRRVEAAFAALRAASPAAGGPSEPPVANLWQHDETGRTVAREPEQGHPGRGYSYVGPLYLRAGGPPPEPDTAGGPEDDPIRVGGRFFICSCGVEYHHASESHVRPTGAGPRGEGETPQ